MAAGELRVGDRVRSASGEGEVEAVESVASPQVMYNLTVAEAHTFFVGDGQWLVHNACPGRWTRVAESNEQTSDRISAKNYWPQYRLGYGC